MARKRSPQGCANLFCKCRVWNCCHGSAKLSGSGEVPQAGTRSVKHALENVRLLQRQPVDLRSTGNGSDLAQVLRRECPKFTPPDDDTSFEQRGDLILTAQQRSMTSGQKLFQGIA